MKKVLIFLFILVVMPKLAYSAPVILFSDLSAAPKTGWDSNSPSKGAVVTIWGFGFGGERSDSFVTVNGTSLTDDASYVDVWGKKSNPVPNLETITFQLDSSMQDGKGSITVTVNNKSSNGIDFYINDGRIFFVDINKDINGDGSISNPWNNPIEFIRQSQLKAGDSLYFREGTYNEIYISGKSVIWLDKNRLSGTETHPIALIGYPGETALIDNLTNGSSQFKSGIKIDVPYYTVAKLNFTSYSNAIEGRDYFRAVGNDAEGTKVLVDGTGIIVLTGNGGKILGNTAHGGRSKNRLDHAIYISGCAPIEGNELGWNYIYDNDIDRGPNIVVNHQGGRCPSSVYVKSHFIHHNIVDCSDFPSRGIGLFDQSWDVGELNEPEATYVYGNIVLSCGIAGYAATYQSSAHGVWFNNLIYDAVGQGMSVAGSNFLSSAVYNNIITLSDSSQKYISNLDSRTLSSNNLYFGAGNYSGLDANPINADPKITIDKNNWQIFLDKDSPAIDSAYQIPYLWHNIDFNGKYIDRSTMDVGPFQYFTKPHPPFGIEIN